MNHPGKEESEKEDEGTRAPTTPRVVHLWKDINTEMIKDKGQG